MGSDETASDYTYGQLLNDARSGDVVSITQEDSHLTATLANGDEVIAVVPSELTQVTIDLGCQAGEIRDHSTARSSAPPNPAPPEAS